MKLLLMIFIYCLTSTLTAQIIAITDTGEEVFLYSDGTWTYADTAKSVVPEITENPIPFSKPENSSFLLKSKRVNVGFWLNAKKWNFKKAVENEAAEYELSLKDGDLYGMIITEKFEMPLLSLREVALENARSVAPDIKIKMEEYRKVNGLKLYCMQMDGSTQGIHFSYYSYYFSNPNGSVQFVTYTSRNMLEEYIEEIQELLNGFVEIEE